ncbi:MAG: protein jag [Oscillospiraceae bacterium]|jgi:spoIIIJ-associated protein|nr:protein jag [Oscillospiraceae bacterium]
MEKYIEASGKTLDEAISAALAQLNMDRDSVSVEVLDKPKPGFLGIGGTLARVRVTYQAGRDTRVTAFLEGLLERMDANASLELNITDEGNLEYTMSGSKTGILIGRRGETLDAMQHLAGSVANRGEESPVRVTLDAENYRAKREASLIELATRTAAKAVKYRRNVPLDPMNSYSRHVIHTALQDYPGVTTHSVGNEPNRRVIISVPGGDRRRQ